MLAIARMRMGAMKNTAQVYHNYFYYSTYTYTPARDPRELLDGKENDKSIWIPAVHYGVLMSGSV